MVHKALITGITGQDGALLAHHLLNQNYRIIAPTRPDPDCYRLKSLGIDQCAEIEYVSYHQWQDFSQILARHQPDEVYHLAAMSHVGESHRFPDQVFDVNVMWVTQMLDAILQYSNQSKLFFASSAEIFKSDLTGFVTETDEKLPNNPYGISKLSAHLMVQYYRNIKGIYASNGILFNHESELRHESFVSKKICREVARVVKYSGQPLYLGNVDAKKDWGYAHDFVKIFQAILTQQQADDYIIATGVLHSVQDMVDCAFAALDYSITWSGEALNKKAYNAQGEVVVAVDEQFFRPIDDRFLKGSTKKIEEDFSGIELTPFSDWVRAMTLNEYRKLT